MTTDVYGYPIIPPEYREAMKYACREIRERGYYNVVMDEVEELFDIDDMEDFKKHYHARAGAGARIANARRKPRRLKYYKVMGFRTWSASCSLTSEDTIKEMYDKLECFTRAAYSEADLADKEFKKCRLDHNGFYRYRWFQPVIVKEFGTKKKADAYKFDISPDALLDMLRKMFPDNRDDTNEQMSFF